MFSEPFSAASQDNSEPCLPSSSAIGPVHRTVEAGAETNRDFPHRHRRTKSASVHSSTSSGIAPLVKNFVRPHSGSVQPLLRHRSSSYSGDQVFQRPNYATAHERHRWSSPVSDQVFVQQRRPKSASQHRRRSLSTIPSVPSSGINSNTAIQSNEVVSKIPVQNFDTGASLDSTPVPSSSSMGPSRLPPSMSHLIQR